MRLTRGTISLIIVGLVAIAALTIGVFPGVVPNSVLDTLGVLEEESMTTITVIVIGGILLIVSLLRLYNQPAASVNRRLIVPETQTGGVGDSEQPGSEIQGRIINALRNAEQLSLRERFVVVYGRRASTIDEIPPEINTLFEELTATAVRSYALAHNVSDNEAREIIDNGKWTDDRVAAAFLAKHVDVEPRLTRLERFEAWLFPDRTLAKRTNTVLTAIEQVSEQYLTYDAPEDTRVGEVSI